jgi:hypothetical protein
LILKSRRRPEVRHCNADEVYGTNGSNGRAVVSCREKEALDERR